MATMKSKSTFNKRPTTSKRPGPSTNNDAYKRLFYKKKTCPLSGKNAPVIDYKNIRLLKKYTSEGGRILPSRITSICHKKQQELSKAIKIARVLALLPFVQE
jgi:small subunit ribosomal protein S18